jgi:hypothetical protein
MSITSDPHGRPIAVTPEAESAATQPQGANSGRHMSMVVIGLAVVARIMRDPRTHEAAIVAVIAVAAVAGLGKASRAKSFARLAAWDKRLTANELRKLKRGKASG